MSFPLDGLGSAWVVGGGYKYLQLGEGNCFLRVPPRGEELRPRFTGWYAEFAELAAEKTPGAVEYPRGGMRFAGATYDPTSHYRAARVFDFFREHGLTPEALRANYLRQTTLLAHALGVEGRREDYGGFVAVEVPDAEYPTLGCNVLAVRPGVVIAADGNPVTRRGLEKAGCEVHAIPLGEVGENGSGGVTCLTRPIHRA